MFLKVSIILITLGLLNIRCSDFRRPQAGQVSLSEGEKFSVTLEGLPEPNKFRARINFIGDSSKYELQRTSNNQKQVSKYNLANTSRDGLEDDSLRVGEKYTYSIGVVKNGEFKTAATQVIEVKPDLVIDGVFGEESKEPLRIQNQFRIYFRNGASLKTFGRDLSIDVEEIFSEGGILETFGESEAALIGQNGSPSGRVEIKAKKLVGPIHINIRGQKGGAGQKGATGPIGLEGAPSNRMVDIGFEIVSHFPEGCAAQYYSPDNRKCPGLSYEECRWRFHPGVGGPGDTGGIGFQGLPGYWGGDAQDAFINIEEGIENLNVTYAPGAGGDGGEGGDGGPGGPGGAGGPTRNNSPGMPCEGSPAGRPGNPGPQGPKGPPGPSGKLGALKVNGVVR